MLYKKTVSKFTGTRIPLTCNEKITGTRIPLTCNEKITRAHLENIIYNSIQNSVHVILFLFNMCLFFSFHKPLFLKTDAW